MRDVQLLIERRAPASEAPDLSRPAVGANEVLSREPRSAGATARTDHRARTVRQPRKHDEAAAAPPHIEKVAVIALAAIVRRPAVRAELRTLAQPGEAREPVMKNKRHAPLGGTPHATFCLGGPRAEPPPPVSPRNCGTLCHAGCSEQWNSLPSAIGCRTTRSCKCWP